MLTIAAGLFVLGFFLMVNANLQRLVGRWTRRGGARGLPARRRQPPTAGDASSDLIASSGLAASAQYVSKDDAAASSRGTFRTWPAAALRARAQSVSRLVRGPAEAGRAGRRRDAVDNMATTLTGIAGVADVRYDRTLARAVECGGPCHPRRRASS